MSPTWPARSTPFWKMSRWHDALEHARGESAMSTASAPDLVLFHRSSVESPWLRVLFITSMWPDALRPHYGTFIHTQAQSLESLGIAVDVVSIRGYASSRAYPAARRHIASARAHTHYDLVHIHTGHAAAVGLLGKRGPTVISYVGGDLLGNPGESGAITAKSRIEASVFRQLAGLSNRTITKSQEMEQALPRRLRSRNQVVPNGVNLDAFEPRPRAEARSALGWDQEEPVALFLGDPSDPRKNVALAQAAMSEVQKRVPNARLHIGWGSRPIDIPSLMWASDALAFTSRSEGSPNVVKEAMAAGLPIVATPVGDVPERLQGVDGCFVVALDAGAFADALCQALAFGRAPGAREAVAPLSLMRIADQIATLYEHLTGIKAPRTSRPTD
jgi:teichuronic acid biosynthesis glycosyltransferase TuaC